MVTLLRRAGPPRWPSGRPQGWRNEDPRPAKEGRRERHRNRKHEQCEARRTDDAGRDFRCQRRPHIAGNHSRQQAANPEHHRWQRRRQTNQRSLRHPRHEQCDSIEIPPRCLRVPEPKAAPAAEHKQNRQDRDPESNQGVDGQLADSRSCTRSGGALSKSSIRMPSKGSRASARAESAVRPASKVGPSGLSTDEIQCPFCRLTRASTQKNSQ